MASGGPLEACPSCGEVLEYVEGGITYYRTVGVQVRGFYDGVAMWQCPVCRHHWARDFGAGTRRQEIADRLAYEANVRGVDYLRPDAAEVIASVEQAARGGEQ